MTPAVSDEILTDSENEGGEGVLAKNAEGARGRGGVLAESAEGERGRGGEGEKKIKNKRKN